MSVLSVKRPKKCCPAFWPIAFSKSQSLKQTNLRTPVDGSSTPINDFLVTVPPAVCTVDTMSYAPTASEPKLNIPVASETGGGAVTVA